MPGVPDTYQGTELWDNSLVDPDNRRPVDFGVRRAAGPLDAGWRRRSTPTGGEAAASPAPLRLRRDRPELFTGYRPVPAHGPAGGHAVAFDRGGAIAVATRLPLGLAAAGGWGDTRSSLPVGEVARPVHRPGLQWRRLRWPTCWPATPSRCWSHRRLEAA